MKAENLPPPEKDRNEFEKRLDAILNPMRGEDLKNCVMKIVEGDLKYSEALKKRISDMKLKKESYLKEYDAAQNDEDRMKIVAKVVR